MPEDDQEADQRLEEGLMRQGLLTASTASLDVPTSWVRSAPFVLDTSARDLDSVNIVAQQEVQAEEQEKAHRSGEKIPLQEVVEEDDQRHKDFAFLKRQLVSQFGLEKQLPEEDPLCRRLQTSLLMPFYFWPDVEEETPAAVASALLARVVRVQGGRRCALWEETSLPDVSELSRHFRQLLGGSGVSSLMQRLRLTDAARSFLFDNARLWAECKTGDYAGKQCLWTNVQLLVFPHGAVLLVTVDWLGSDAGSAESEFSLSDLRSWLYVAKFRAVKVGVTRGWSFTRRLCPGELVEAEQDALGLEMFAAV